MLNATFNVVPVEGVAGSVLSLHCESEGTGATPTWKRIDGTRLSVSSVTASDGSLFFGSVSLADSGVYQCSVDGTAASLLYNVTIIGE